MNNPVPTNMKGQIKQTTSLQESVFENSHRKKKAYVNSPLSVK